MSEDPARMSKLSVLALMPHPDEHLEILLRGNSSSPHSQWDARSDFATTAPGGQRLCWPRTKQKLQTFGEKRPDVQRSLPEAKSYTCLEFSDLEIVFDNG